jgi:hypothetical protein
MRASNYPGEARVGSDEGVRILGELAIAPRAGGIE